MYKHRAIHFNQRTFTIENIKVIDTLSLDVRHVQALCQAQNDGTKLGVKGVAGKKHKEKIVNKKKKENEKTRQKKKNKINVTNRKTQHIQDNYIVSATSNDT